MNKHSIVLFVLLVAIGVGMGAAIDWQKSQAPALGAAGGTASAATAVPAGGGLVINGMAVGAAPPAQGATPAAAPESPAAVTPAHSADAAACP